MNLNNDIFEESGLTPESKQHLLETAKWTKFLSIIGFIGTGIMFIIMIFMLAGGSYFAALSGSMAPGFSFAGIAIMWIFMLALYIYPIYAMYQFSKYLKIGINSNSSEDLTIAFRHQKGMYKFMGILMVILLCIYALIFIFGILSAAIA